MEFDPRLLVPDDRLSISQGAIAVLGWQSCMNKGSFANAILAALCQEYGFDMSTPWRELPEKVRKMLMFGADKSVDVHYEGQRGKGISFRDHARGV